MNKLLTYGGGQPITTGDFEFLQRCYTEVIECIVQGIGKGMNCILFGIESIADGIVVGYANEGAVCIGGEVLMVNTALDVPGARYLCFRLVESEAREFKDSQTHKVYRTHEAYLSVTTDGADKFLDLTKAKRLADVMSGEAFWEVSEIRIPADGVTGKIEERKVQGIWEIRINLVKNTSTDNVLYNFPTTRLPNPLLGIAVNELTNKVVVLRDVVGNCKLYNADGTECIEPVELMNVILK